MKILRSYTMLLLLLALAKNMQAQKPELIIPATHNAGSLLISPDEKWLVSAGSTGIKIWDNKTGSLLKNLAPGSKNIERFGRGTIYMAFDKNSRWLAMEIEEAVYFFHLTVNIYTLQVITTKHMIPISLRRPTLPINKLHYCKPLKWLHWPHMM